MCYSLWYNAPTMLPDGDRQHRGCIIPQAVTHSLVLLKMGGIIARNMFVLIGIFNKPLLLHLVGVYIIYTIKICSNFRCEISARSKISFRVLKFMSVRSEILTTGTMALMCLSCLTPCNLLKVYRRFREICLTRNRLNVGIIRTEYMALQPNRHQCSYI